MRTLATLDQTTPDGINADASPTDGECTLSQDLVIPTPLGSLRMSLDMDAPADSELTESRQLPSGAMIHRWRRPDEFELLALVTRYDGVFNGVGQFVVSESWGVVWTLHAIDQVAPLTVRAELDGPFRVGSAYDECLAAVEVETPTWLLAVGGPDDELLSERVASGELPTSWRGKILSYFDPHDSPYGEDMSDQGLRWFLPALEPGESATTHVAAAWSRAGLPDNDTAAWLAVDTEPSYLMAAAGIAPERRHRRGRIEVAWPAGVPAVRREVTRVR